MKIRNPELDKDLLSALKAFVDETYPIQGLGLIVNYRRTLNEILAKPAPEKSDLMYLMHVAKNIGDGLGYDLLLPEYNETGVVILKVEVKSARGKNQRIFFSLNEINCILALKDDPNWRLWFNTRFSPELSQRVKEYIIKHSQQYAQLEQIYLNSETWYMEVN